MYLHYRNSLPVISLTFIECPSIDYGTQSVFQ